MIPTELAHLKALLTQQLKNLLRQSDETVAGARAADYNCSDPLDRASHDEAQDNLFRIRDRESRLINKIRNALACIADGSYGICEICGEEISYKRLEARPVTTKCIHCKTREERIERVID